MLTSFEGNELDVQKAIRLIRENKDQFQKSNVNYLKMEFYKSVGWANRLLSELEARGIISKINKHGKRDILYNQV